MEHDEGFKRLMKKLEQFEREHTKILLPKRKTLIKRQYKKMLLELEGEADFSLKEEKEAITITVTMSYMLTCDEASCLNYLIGIANLSEFKIKNGFIEIMLWYRCWEHIKK